MEIKIENQYLFDIVVSILFLYLIASQERIIDIYIYFLILQNDNFKLSVIF